MKILVTGANGLLGVNLARHLVEAGETVLAFVRPSANLKGLEGVPCEIIRGDISSYDDIFRAVEKSDAVVHAASTTSVQPLGFEYFKKVNVEATEIVVRAILNSRLQRLVYVSTANAFGPGSKQNPGNESSPFNLSHYHSGYINSKHMAQELVLENVARYNLKAVIANPTFMIGPYDTKPSSGKIILHGLSRGIQWCPPGGKNFVHVQDVAEGVYQALQHGKSGECYLLGGQNLTYKEFFTLLNNFSGRKRLRITIPKALLHAAGALNESLSQVTGHTVAFNKTNAKLLSLDNYYSTDKANRELNLKPKEIKDALNDALSWFIKERYVSADFYSIQGTNLDL